MTPPGSPQALHRHNSADADLAPRHGHRIRRYECSARVAITGCLYLARCVARTTVSWAAWQSPILQIPVVTTKCAGMTSILRGARLPVGSALPANAYTGQRIHQRPECKVSLGAEHDTQGSPFRAAVGNFPVAAGGQSRSDAARGLSRTARVAVTAESRYAYCVCAYTFRHCPADGRLGRFRQARES